MEREFPHLSDTRFPGVSNVDVYKYRNTFDYTRWGADTVIKVMSTRLDPNYENVGGWDSVEARDAWFDAQEGESVTLSSALHMKPDNSIKLPFPPSVMAAYDYVMVTLPVATSTADPVRYENARNRVTRFFYFVTDIIQRAENATQCVLQLDYWTTYAPRAQFPYMMLERGHYPLANSNVDEYLNDPVNNSEYLRAPDVSAATPTVCKSASDVIFNSGDMLACFATAADPLLNWGEKDNSWNVPATRSYHSQHGTPTVFVFYIASSDLQEFLENAETSAPQFKRAVLAMFLVPASLVSASSTFEFCGITCSRPRVTQQRIPLLDLKRESFGYDRRYSGLAKLYTYPYAHIEVSDGENATQIKIEDTTGSIDVMATVQLAWPFLAIDSYLEGVGGSGAARSLTFKNLSTETMHVSGTWYDTVKRWDIPTYAVIQSAAREYDYSSYYQRKQARLEADTANANVKNANAAVKSNAALENATASANNAHANKTAGSVTTFGNGLNQALQAWDAGLSRGSTDITNDAVAATTAANAIGNIVGNVGAGALSGGLMGAASGLGAGIANGVTAGVSAAITISKNSALAEATIANSQAKVNETNSNNNDVLLQQTNHATYVTDETNSLRTDATANTVSASNANADNTKSTAYAGVTAGTHQAALNAPSLNGTFADGDTAATRPMGLYASVVTQPYGAICAAGDAFCRYGYALGQAVNVTTLNVMEHFAYWKASDVWITGAGITAGAREQLRAILYAGATVWRNPSEIGEVSIYDN